MRKAAAEITRLRSELAAANSRATGLEKEIAVIRSYARQVDLDAADASIDAAMAREGWWT